MMDFTLNYLVTSNGKKKEVKVKKEGKKFWLLVFMYIGQLIKS